MRKVWIAVMLGIAACHTRPAPQAPAEKHLFLRSRPGAALYLDPVYNQVVLQVERTAPNRFCCFRIGWADSAAGIRPSMERERYFQYRVQYDWKAVADGDTLLPVFFQERQGLGGQVKEGVMVFETPQGRQPDTLVYRDSYGAWGTQVFVLNRK